MPRTPLPEASLPATSDIKNQCADAYEATQRERAAGHQLAARKNGIFCAQTSCPEVLRGDCAKWEAELSSSIPSLVIEVRNPHGELLTNVYVELDGAPFAQHLDGRAFEIDSGRHHFRFEALGFSAQERDVVVLQGNETERLRVVLQPEPMTPPARRSIPRISYVLGGVGVLALGSFSYFGLSGNHKRNALEVCRPACASDLEAPIKQDYVAADVSLGAALVSVGVAAYLAIRGQDAPASEQALRVRVSTDSALITVQHEF